MSDALSSSVTDSKSKTLSKIISYKELNTTISNIFDVRAVLLSPLRHCAFRRCVVDYVFTGNI